MKTEVVKEFVNQVQEAVDENSFVSLTLRGVKRKRGAEIDTLRGSIRQVKGRMIKVKRGTALQLTLKYHGATDICKNLNQNEISTRLHELILEPLASEWGIEAVQAQPIQSAELQTLTQTVELTSLSGKPSLKEKSVAKRAVVQPDSHDRTKLVPIDSEADFLQALGVTRPDGKPRPGMSSKLRQCNKFVEIVNGLVENQMNDNGRRTSGKPPALRVVDMGCGRGYLTFALHSYLVERYKMVSSLGIDVRPKLVAEISEIARSLGRNFESLRFEEGSIEAVTTGRQNVLNDYDNLKQTERRLNILIALHACDTATDDALWSGINSLADIIVVAPCCHKEIRQQLNTHVVEQGQLHPLYDILKHGIYRERISETVTDSLRALLLERVGYKVQVFEFIGGEHTSKNVMITAVKNEAFDPTVIDSIQERIKDLASFHGIKRQRLAQLIGEDLGSPMADMVSRRMSTMQMPPKA